MSSLINVFCAPVPTETTHSRAEENVPYECYVFRQLTPTKGETADKFMVRLRKRARHCNFVATLDENLRNQLIEKLLDVELKKKLLDVNKITLEAAMDKVLKWDRSLTCAGESNGHAKPRTWNRH